MAVRFDKTRITISITKDLFIWIWSVKSCSETVSEFIERCLKEKVYDKQKK